ncbi:hypothetical protein BGZ73_003071 [Actinomortierella ambigua]|nr:hypothetical protein BGZ73_003071 [Actinomortierella ambigua]
MATTEASADVVYDCRNINCALTAQVPDEEALVTIIGRREPHQLVMLTRFYREAYGVDLPTELEKRVSDSVGKLLARACQHKIIADVHYIYNAGKTNRKHEQFRRKDNTMQVLLEVLVGRTPADIKELKEAFPAVFQTELQPYVLSLLKDEEEAVHQFFIEILKDKPNEPLPDMEAAVDHLHQLLTTETKQKYEYNLLDHVSKLTTSQLDKLVYAYNSKNRDAHVVTVLRTNFKAKKCNKKVAEIVLFTVMRCADAPRHIAHQFEESMAGMGTHEDMLSRLVARHSGKGMLKILDAYKLDFDRTLADRIRGDTSGLYTNLLLHLIQQTL